MTDFILSQQGQLLLITKIQEYYRNFGSMNKNDFEVLLFYVLAADGNHAKSNFELSRLLRLPEAKIKRLRYEADLKYGPELDHDQFRAEKFQQLNNLLRNVSLKRDGSHIEFVVEDIALRRFLDNILKSHNRFSDSSFNSEIVKIDPVDLEILLRQSSADAALCDELLSDARRLLDDSSVTFAELLPDLIRLAANVTSVDVTAAGLLSLLKAGSATLVKVFSRKKEPKSKA